MVLLFDVIVLTRYIIKQVSICSSTIRMNFLTKSPAFLQTRLCHESSLIPQRDSYKKHLQVPNWQQYNRIIHKFLGKITGQLKLNCVLYVAHSLHCLQLLDSGHANRILSSVHPCRCRVLPARVKLIKLPQSDARISIARSHAALKLFPTEHLG